MSKSAPMWGMIIGSTIGGFVPTLFGADIFSLWGIIGTLIGGILGIWLGLKFSGS